MLMFSFVHFNFVCEHLFTFPFCALMPKISKESFAKFPSNAYGKSKFIKIVVPYTKGFQDIVPL